MKEMNTEELLDQIDDMLDKGMSLPGGRRLVEVEKIRVVIDDIRLIMPTEIKQARSIVADRAQILESAKREAESITKAAEDKARAMVAQEEIVRQAQQRANEILTAAQSKSREMRKAAQEFVDDIMRTADDGMTQTLNELRKTRASLRQAIPQAAQRPQE